MNIEYESAFTTIMGRIMRQYHKATDKLVYQYGLSSGQARVLLILNNKDGIKQKELSERLGISAPSLTTLIDRMENNNLVRREPDASDGRASRIHLTSKGLEIISKVNEVFSYIETESLKNFSVEERLLFRRLLMQMYNDMRDLS